MTSAALALATSQFGFQCVERLVPGATELIKPAVELGQGIGIQRVDPASTFSPNLHDAMVTEHPEMLGSSRL